MATNQEEGAPVAADAAPASVEKHSESVAPTKPTEAQEDITTAAQKVDGGEKTAEGSGAAPTEALEKLDISEKHEDKPEETSNAAASTSAAAPLPAPEDEKPATAPATTTTTDAPVWPETAAEHPLTKFFAMVDDLTKEAGHSEVYGVTLSTSSHFHTKLILQKFLRANQGDLQKAKEQLRDTLKWRKDFDPIKAAAETFSKERFDGLGYILEVEGVPESPNEKDIATFNIYGAVKDNKKTFGDLDAFLRWRVGLMERSVQKLNLSTATTPIPDYGQGPDPYQGFQIHDYLQVSMLRQDPLVKVATKATIGILGRYYPETLSRKFFVNVPVVMGWLYQATKLIVAKETAKKFTVLSYGNQLAGELGKGVPVVYGGTTGELASVAEVMKLEG